MVRPSASALVAPILAFALALPALAGAADGDLERRLEAARERFPALLVAGEAAATPDVVLVAGMPEGVEGPAGLGQWRAGTVLDAGEPREGGPELVTLTSATRSGTEVPRTKAPAKRRLAVARRTAIGAPPHEAVVLAVPADEPGGEAIELDLDPRASSFEVWSVGEDGAIERLLSGDRPWGGRSLYLKAEPGGLYVVTLSFPWE